MGSPGKFSGESAASRAWFSVILLAPGRTRSHRGPVTTHRPTGVGLPTPETDRALMTHGCGHRSARGHRAETRPGCGRQRRGLAECPRPMEDCEIAHDLALLETRPHA